MSDGRFYRAILSADFVGRQKIGRFLNDTRAINRTILSAIISAVELGSNFCDKIVRFYRLLVLDNWMACLLPLSEMNVILVCQQSHSVTAKQDRCWTASPTLQGEVHSSFAGTKNQSVVIHICSLRSVTVFCACLTYWRLLDEECGIFSIISLHRVKC